MRNLLLCLLLLGAASLLGGCAGRPVSDSEFRGFCYTHVTHRSSCDTIPLCNEYDADVLSKQFPSRAECAHACQTVYDRLFAQNQFTDCAGVVLYGYEWCMKFCNSNYQ